MVFVRYAKTVVRSWDIVIGCNWMHIHGHTGNSDLWDSIYEEIFAVIQTQAIDYFGGIPARLATIRTGRRVYFAISATHVCTLDDVLDNSTLETVLRQIYCDMLDVLHDPPRDDYEFDVINWVDLRLIWFNTFEVGTIEHLFLRLTEEVPSRGEILSLIIFQNPTQDLLNQMEAGNRNTYNATTKHLTLRWYKTDGTYGNHVYTLSNDLSLAINAYVATCGGYDAYPLLDGHKYLFGFKNKINPNPHEIIHMGTVQNWFATAGLNQFTPFRPDDPGNGNVFSGTRKCLTSFCHEMQRVQGNHVWYKDGQTSFPTYAEMANMQLHTEGVADQYYLFYIRQILVFE